MPSKPKIKISLTNYFMRFRDFVFLWRKNIFENDIYQI
jgi:hypothetical protein